MEIFWPVMSSHFIDRHLFIVNICITERMGEKICIYIFFQLSWNLKFLIKKKKKV